jgi:ParB family chromosome partitioning protein
MKKTGLGKGLDALFADNLLNNTEENIEENADKIHKIKVIEIEPNREQPRRTFDEEALDELASSIKTYGVLQPIIVNKKDNYYEIVAGERRWRAAKKAGLTEMPCIIKDDITEKTNKEIALIENLQRVDLNPIDKAKGLKELIDDYGMTQKELADSIGISRSNIANSIRILNLDPRVIQLAEEGKITEGHCRNLVVIEDPEKQYKAALNIINNGESVRDIERKVKNNKVAKKIDPRYEAIYRDIEDSFQGFFGTKVKLDAHKKSGKIIIQYSSYDDLERILGLINKE